MSTRRRTLPSDFKALASDNLQPVLDFTNSNAVAKPARSENNELEVNIKELMEQVSPCTDYFGYSEERVKQLRLLANHHKRLSRQEMEVYVLPYVYELFLKGFSIEEMSTAFGVAPKVVNDWIEAIRTLNKDKLDGYDALAAVTKTFDQYDLILKSAMEDYSINKGSATGNTSLKIALQILNDKMKWSYDLNLLDPVKNKGIFIDDKGAKQKKVLDSVLTKVLTKIQDFKKDQSQTALQLGSESSNSNTGDK